MNRTNWITLLLLLSFLGLEWSLGSGCAQIVPLQGGPKDTIPPQLDSANSTPNLQTNFQKQVIQLTFEEFVQLNNVFEQVVVSPPLKTRPTISLKKYRTVEFEFDAEEELRPDATYIINFGEAIKDYTEGNVAPIRFIFSTGDFIDSLEVRGKVVDAREGKPVKGALVMLYDNLNDTVVRTERPFYFSRTQEDGSFLIQNVKSDTFKVFALMDAEPANYLFDNATEGIAFLDSNIVTSDTTPAPLLLSYFLPEPPLLLLEDKRPRYGLLKLLFNREPYDAQITYDDIGQYWFQETIEDTIQIWYDWNSSDSFNIYVQTDTTSKTLTVKSGKKQEFLEEAKLRQTNALQGGRQQTIPPAKPHELAFNHPLAAIDTSLVRLYKDSTRTPATFVLTIDTLHPQKAQLNSKWTEKALYELVLLPGALTDVFGIKNDTIRRKYLIDEKKNYGNILLTINQLDSTQQYLIELFQRNDLFDRYTVAQDTAFSIQLFGLKPGEYKVQIVEDRNGNGRWDPGNYDRKTQSETLYSKTLESLRANWDLEATLSIDKLEN